MELVKVQNKLKLLGIDYSYKENESFSVELYDFDGNFCSLTFKDVLGKEHIVKVYYVNYSVKSRLDLDDNWIENQTEICKWIDENNDLLTDYDELMRKKEAEKKAIEERKYQSQIIDVKEYTSGKYKMTIKTERSNYIYYDIKVSEYNKFTPPMSVINANRRGKKVKIEIQTTAYGAIEYTEAKEFLSEWESALNALEHFNSELNLIE